MNRFRECCFKTIPKDGRRLIWEITHSCNFNCDYCFQSRKRLNNPMRVLNETDLIKISTIIKELNIQDVLITGGEIYQAKDVLDTVCKTLRNSVIPISFSTMHYLNEDFVNVLFSFQPRSLNISLDPRGESEGQETWRKYLVGADKVLCKGDISLVNVKITSVINRNNIANFGEYFDCVKKLCREHKSLSSVYITNPYEIGYVKDNVRVPQAELTEIISTKALQNNLPKAISFVNFPRNNAPLQKCLAGSHYVHCEPNGNVYPCHLFANYNEDVFLMGNILYDDIADIDTRLRIFAVQAEEAVRKYKGETPSCKKCDDINSCGGGCLAEVISAGQLIEPQLICKHIPPPRPFKSFIHPRQPSLSLGSREDLSDTEEEKIADYIKSNLRHHKHDLAHGFDHTSCVVKLARYIAMQENANLRIVTVASYFHDFAPRQELIFESHTKLSAEKAVTFLKKIGFSESELSEVYLCIDTSSYGSSQLGSLPNSLEAKIVRDADWLDAIGARGIARVFAFASAHGCEVLGTVEWDPDNPVKKRMSLVGPDPSPIYHFFSKLLWIKDKMQTKTGKLLAEQRHKTMVDYLKQYKSEMFPEGFSAEI